MKEDDQPVTFALWIFSCAFNPDKYIQYIVCRYTSGTSCWSWCIPTYNVLYIFVRIECTWKNPKGKSDWLVIFLHFLGSQEEDEEAKHNCSQTWLALACQVFRCDHHCCCHTFELSKLSGQIELFFWQTSSEWPNSKCCKLCLKTGQTSFSKLVNLSSFLNWSNQFCKTGQTSFQKLLSQLSDQIEL
jgi:hypothetical protein